MFQICKTFTFEAAHFLRDYDGDCARLHGHHYEVAVCVEGESLDAIGLLLDFGVIKAAARQVAGAYDHHLLNEIAPYDEVNPSAENIARTIYLGLRAELALRSSTCRLAYVQVGESPTAWAKYWE